LGATVGREIVKQVYPIYFNVQFELATYYQSSSMSFVGFKQFSSVDELRELLTKEWINLATTLSTLVSQG